MKMSSTGVARKDAARKVLVMGLLQKLDRKKLVFRAGNKSGVSASEMRMECSVCCCDVTRCIPACAKD